MGQELGFYTTVNGVQVFRDRGYYDNWFFEDDQQAEDGKQLEMRLFGTAMGQLGSSTKKTAFLHPGPVGLWSWPMPHLNPRTSEWNGLNSCGAYTSVGSPGSNPLDVQCPRRLARELYLAMTLQRLVHYKRLANTSVVVP